MPDEAKLTRDNSYEEVAMQFLQIMGVEVDLALRSAGITDQATREKVVDTFCFGMGNFFDQYWFDWDGERYWPVLSFSKLHWEDESFAEARFPNISYHEYAMGTFESIALDGQTYAEDIQFNFIGQDEPMDLNAVDE